MADEISIQDQSKELENDKPVYCRYHKQEIYQLYCKECRDFVCFECLNEKHPGHNFCRLRDAKSDVVNELKTLLSNKVNGNGCIDIVKNKLEETKTKLMQKESEIKRELQDTAKSFIDNIRMSESKLLSSVSDIFSKYTKEVYEVEQLVDDISFVAAYEDEERFNELASSQIVKILSDLKHCIVEANKTFDQYNMPTFTPNSPQPVGNICATVESELCVSKGSSNVPGKLSMCQMLTAFTQTEENYLEESDTEYEFFDAEDRPGEYLNENSSDEIQDSFPFMINLDNSIKLIHKIIPLSDTDAWILTDRKLCKITEQTLGEELYLENVDDIAVINKVDVLILRKDNDFIMRLLSDKRLVKFWGTGNAKNNALCLCTTENDTIIICVRGSDSSGHYIIKLDNNGVELERMFYKCYFSPCIVVNKQADLCFTYKRYDNTLTLHFRKDNGKSCNYNGVFGFYPPENFVCHGICTDNAGNILVSDNRHHTVYALDSNLKYKNCIVDAKDGLNNPAAIALCGNRLWVGDGHYIFIFEYKGDELDATKPN